MEFSKDELKEIALSLNLISAERNAYLLDDSINKYKENNNKYLEMDKILLNKIKLEIKRLKEGVEE